LYCGSREFLKIGYEAIKAVINKTMMAEIVIILFLIIKKRIKRDDEVTNIRGYMPKLKREFGMILASRI